MAEKLPWEDFAPKTNTSVETDGAPWEEFTPKATAPVEGEGQPWQDFTQPQTPITEIEDSPETPVLTSTVPEQRFEQNRAQLKEVERNKKRKGIADDLQRRVDAGETVDPQVLTDYGDLVELPEPPKPQEALPEDDEQGLVFPERTRSQAAKILQNKSMTENQRIIQLVLLLESDPATSDKYSSYIKRAKRFITNYNKQVQEFGDNVARKNSADETAAILRPLYLGLKSFAGGLSLGLTDVPLSMQAKAGGGEVEPESTGESLLMGGTRLGASLITGMGAAKGIGYLLAKTGMRKSVQMIGTRLLTNVAIVAPQQITGLVTGDVKPEEFTGNVTQSVGASIPAMVAEFGLPQGIVNSVMQVVADFTYDMATDIARGRLKVDENFTQWLLETELPQLVGSAVFAINDLKDPNFEANRRTVLRDLKGIFKGDMLKAGLQPKLKQPVAKVQEPPTTMPVKEQRTRVEVPEAKAKTKEVPPAKPLDKLTKQMAEKKVEAKAKLAKKPPVKEKDVEKLAKDLTKVADERTAKQFDVSRNAVVERISGETGVPKSKVIEAYDSLLDPSKKGVNKGVRPITTFDATKGEFEPWAYTAVKRKVLDVVGREGKTVSEDVLAETGKEAAIETKTARTGVVRQEDQAWVDSRKPKDQDILNRAFAGEPLTKDEQARGRDLVNERTKQITGKQKVTAEDRRNAFKSVGAASARDTSAFVAGAPIGKPSETMSGTALNKAADEIERASKGISSPPKTETKEMAVEWVEADKTIRKNPFAPHEIIESVVANPAKGLSDAESAVLLRHKVGLEAEINKSIEAMYKGKSADERLKAEQSVELAMKDLETVMNVAKTAGTAWGRSGRWRQMIANEDYTLGNMFLKAKAKKGGKDLTGEEKLKIQMLQKELADAKAEVNRVRGRADDVGSKEEGQRVFKDFIAEPKPDKGKAPPPTPDKDTVITNKLVRELMRVEVDSGVRNLDKAINNVHAILAKVQPDITPRRVRDIFSDYGKYKTPSQKPTDVVLSDLRAQSQKVSQLEDIMAGKAPKKTGQGRHPPSQETRELTKKVNKAMKEAGINVRGDPEKRLKSSLDAIKTRLSNSIEDLDKAIKRREKMVVNKTQVPYDAEANLLKYRRDALKKQYNEMFPKEPLTDAERYDLAIKSAKRSLDNWDEKLTNAKKGIFPPEISKTKHTTLEMINIRKQRDASKVEFDKLRDAAMPDRKDAIALKLYKNRMDRQMAGLEAKLKAGVLPAKKVKKKYKLDDVATDKEFKLEELRRKWKEMQFNLQLAQRNKWQIVGQGMEEVWNTLRATVASFDFGHLRRQGGLHLLSRPIESFKLIPETLRALKSDKQSFKTDLRIRNDPLYMKAKKAGLFFNEENTGLNNMEDVYRGRWWKKVPGIAASGRAYTTGLNLIRHTMFKRFVGSLSRGGENDVTDEQLQTVANFINNWTGRGGLGKFEQGSRALADIMFSPRLATSRFKVLLAPLSGMRMYGKSPRVRTLIVKEYARYLAGVAAYWGAIATGANTFLGLPGKDKKWDINFNPLSGDFGKIRIGNTRLDPLSGLQQPLVLLARMAMGKKITSKGKEVSLYGPDVPYGGDTILTLLGRFVRSKASPGMSLASNIITRQHYFGDPINAKEMLYNVTPMALRDTYEGLNDMYNEFGKAGIPAGLTIGLWSMAGEGIQTYEQPTKAERERRRSREFLDWEDTKFMGTNIEETLGFK